MQDLLLPTDTETCGFPRKNIALDDKQQPHLVSIAALQYNVTTSKVEQSLSVIIKPDGWTIPDETIAVHGITNEKAHALGIPEKTAIDVYLNLWAGVDNPCLLIAHNSRFDKDMIAIAIARYQGQGYILDQWLKADSFCTQKESKEKVQAKDKNGRLKLPKLSESYRYFFNEEIEHAHNANSDCVACLKIFLALHAK